METISHIVEGLHSAEKAAKQHSKAVEVYVRLVFLRIGEIDTLNEKYQAHASIASHWFVNFDNLSKDLSTDDQRRLNNGKTISLGKYSETHWHPQLYIENALGDLKEQITYTAKKSKDDNLYYVYEHRDIKGLFWEKLELYHFPSDVQDLSISVASMLPDGKVLLIADPHHFSGVNREAFVDQQEWSLYEHVDTQERFIKEFNFRSNEDDDDENENNNNNDNRKRSVITVTCHAARRSNYFIWNGYCLILLITLLSFCVYMIPPHLLPNRLQMTATLLLTSITFRWTVNRSLPTISYLTTLDKYAIFCIFNLVIHAIWHSIIGAIIFATTPDFRVTPNMWLTNLDRGIFGGTLGIFILIHIGFIIWLICVPLQHRKNMAKKDVQYRLLVSEKNKSNSNQLLEQYSRKYSDHLRIPIEIKSDS